MKKVNLLITIISSMLLILNTDAYAQWTHNATTQVTYLTNSNDKVGIGTISPVYKLSIAGSGSALGFDNASVVGAKNSTGSYEGFLWPRWSDNATYLNFGSGGFHIRNNSSADAMFLNISGNIGIGTSTPTKHLQVSGSGAQEIGIQSTDAGAHLWTLQSNGTGTLPATFQIIDRTAGLSRLGIDNNGNVGIGTTAPASTLEVNSTNANTSGLRLTKLTSSSPAGTSTGKVLTVNATGDVTLVTESGSSSGWQLSGNSGTDPTTSFIGTSDNKPLIFRINNQQSGKIDSVLQSTFFGYQSGKSNTTGLGGNSFFGYQSGKFTFDGQYNTGIGLQSLYLNQNGSNNTATGTGALAFNISGNFNTADGSFSLSNNLGSYNTGVGFYSLNANTTGYSNTATGYQALKTNNTGYWNSAFGNSALQANTSGWSNTAIGTNALISNQTGYNNTANGAFALNNNTGSANTANGANALYNNTTGFGNTSIGSSALKLNSSANASENTAMGLNALYSNNGYWNTAIGANALYGNTTGNLNIAIGNEALSSNNGSSNIAIGTYSLALNGLGYSNVAVGAEALYKNSWGHNLVAIGDSALFNQGYDASGHWGNTAIGSKALFGNTLGYKNTGVGFNCLIDNNSGYNNSATGWLTLSKNSSGHDNTAFGTYALTNNTTGSFNSAFGSGASIASVLPISNSTTIGANAQVFNSNIIQLGDGNITYVQSTGIFQTLSDGRFKNNIREEVKGLEFINLLRPIVYNFDVMKYEEFEFQNLPEDIRKGKLEEMSKRSQKTSDIRQTGFIAQEVEQAAKKCNYDFNGVHVPENSNDNYGLSYGMFVVPLVKAVQELSTKNENLEKKNADLEARLDNVEQMMNQFDQSLSQCCTSYQSSKTTSTESTIDLAKLEQNIPNPFTQSTIIKFYLPQSANSAVIKIYSMDGAELKSFDVKQNGYGEITLTGNALASGVYAYTFIVDGKAIDTKQMILTK